MLQRHRAASLREGDSAPRAVLLDRVGHDEGRPRSGRADAAPASSRQKIQPSGLRHCVAPPRDSAERRHVRRPAAGAVGAGVLAGSSASDAPRASIGETPCAGGRWRVVHALGPFAPKRRPGIVTVAPGGRPGARDLAAGPAPGAPRRASRWRSTRARRRRCSPTSRWPTARARARRCASCCGPTRIPSTRAGRCGARCRRCARRSARSGSTRPATASRCATGAGLDVDVRRFRALAARRRGPRICASRRRAVPRRAARGVLAARQPASSTPGTSYEADALQRELGAALGRLVQAAGRARRVRAGDPPRPALARARPAARAGPSRADPPLRAERRPRGGARPVPRLRADAQPGARRGAGRGDRGAVRAGERGHAGAAAGAAPAAGRLRRAVPARAARASCRSSGARERARRAASRRTRRPIPTARLAVIEGEAGIGKTRLARELIGERSSSGGVVLAARCHEDEAGLPYGPVVELLARGAACGAGRHRRRRSRRSGWPTRRCCCPSSRRLRPDLPAPVALTGPAAQARLLEGVAAVLGARRPRAGAGLRRRRPRRRRGHARRARLPRPAAARAGRCCCVLALAQRGRAARPPAAPAGDRALARAERRRS